MSNGDAMNKVMLSLKNVYKVFKDDKRKVVTAVKDVNLDIYEGECVAVVGESGCGKSTLVRLITRLTDCTNGQIILDGIEVTALSRKEEKELYRKVQMVFQDPYSVFSPRMQIGTFLEDGLVYHGLMTRPEAHEEAKKLLRMVDLSEELMERLPHQLSGGQLQRVVVARAISIHPKMLLLDEATSALDVSVQKQVLELLARLREELKLTYLFIGHDLAVVRSISDRIVVMYAGRIMEIFPSKEIEMIKHPYTKRLLNSVFSVKQHEAKEIRVESLGLEEQTDTGCCPFYPHCTEATEICRNTLPEMTELEEGHMIRCHNKSWK